MKAALLTEVRKIEMTEMPQPTPGPTDVLVKVMACGLCPNDLRMYSGMASWTKLPTTLGHEPAGVVTAVGEKVRSFKAGDKVAGEQSLRCGYCKPCVEGRENLCLNRKSTSNGALAEYVLMKEQYVNKFTNATFDEEAFTEPLSCVINGEKNSRVRLGDTVAIVGSGQIGLMHMQVARLTGARTIVIDLKADRLEFAAKLGADYVIDSSKTDPVTKVKELTGGDMADRVVVAIGNSAAIETGIQLAGKMGSVNVFASTNPPTKISVDPNLIHHNEVSLIGSYDKTAADLRLATRLIDQHRIDVKSMITHTFDLEHTGEALQTLEKGAGVKIVVRPNNA
ncbi:MAG TPA: alcohol dehydrogenase catalytic domain-containing protein [Nitrososphaerales archaeon]|nr:alcohol dehydrogenase catalytic domain-containing protein [Nitrososphaerales archaeon]